MREQQQKKNYKYCQKLNCPLFSKPILTRQIILSPKNSQEFLASQVSGRRFPQMFYRDFCEKRRENTQQP